MSSIFDRLTRALPWNKPIELPGHHRWKHANLPALLEWRIKARSYNTTVANFMFLVVFMFATLLFGWGGGLFNPDSILVASIGMPFYIVTMVAVYGTTHQKNKFAYRFTEQGIEICEWKAPGKGWMIALKWLTVIVAIAVIFIIAIDPSAFWIALVGPGGMGLLYLGLANSKQYQEMHSLYRHNSYGWSEIKHVYSDRSRYLISLEYEWFNENQKKTLPWWTYVFCCKKEYDVNLEFIKSKLSDTPCTDGKVEVLQF
jgi:hypothetical protein